MKIVIIKSKREEERREEKRKEGKGRGGVEGQTVVHSYNAIIFSDKKNELLNNNDMEES